MAVGIDIAVIAFRVLQRGSEGQIVKQSPVITFHSDIILE